MTDACSEKLGAGTVLASDRIILKGCFEATLNFTDMLG